MIPEKEMDFPILDLPTIILGSTATHDTTITLPKDKCFLGSEYNVYLKNQSDFKMIIKYKRKKISTLSKYGYCICLVDDTGNNYIAI